MHAIAKVKALFSVPIQVTERVCTTKGNLGFIKLRQGVVSSFSFNHSGQIVVYFDNVDGLKFAQIGIYLEVVIVIAQFIGWINRTKAEKGIQRYVRELNLTKGVFLLIGANANYGIAFLY